MADVLIAGGGIAGSSLAIMLGSAGFSVALFERGRFPREQPCGEGVMPAGVGALERLGLAEAAGGAPFQGIRYHAGSVVAEAQFPSGGKLPPAGRGQRRLRLGQLLFDAASTTPGVTAYPGTAAEAPLIESGRVAGLVIEGEPRRARLVVIADGSHSSLRHQLGLDGPPPRRLRTGIRTHFRLAPDRVQPDWVEVYLGSGYEFYVTPLPDRELLVAALAEREALRSGATVSFARWLQEQPVLAARLRGAERLTPYLGRSPLASPALAGVTPGAVLLGDAAGYLDPITGGGITQALLTAELLAKYVPRLLEDGEAALARFERQRRDLLRDYLLLTRLVLRLSHPHWLATTSVRLMRASPRLFSHLIGVAAGSSRLLP